MNTQLLITAVRFYLRQEARLQRAGNMPLSQQPESVEAEAWASAVRAAGRYERLAARQPVPVKKDAQADA